jgi:hypothetical protein
MKTWWGSGDKLHTLLTSALDGGEWSASRPMELETFNGMLNRKFGKELTANPLETFPLSWRG